MVQPYQDSVHSIVLYRSVRSCIVQIPRAVIPVQSCVWSGLLHAFFCYRMSIACFRRCANVWTVWSSCQIILDPSVVDVGKSVLHPLVKAVLGSIDQIIFQQFWIISKASRLWLSRLAQWCQNKATFAEGWNGPIDVFDLLTGCDSEIRLDTDNMAKYCSRNRLRGLDCRGVDESERWTWS